VGSDETPPRNLSIHQHTWTPGTSVRRDQEGPQPRDLVIQGQYYAVIAVIGQEHKHRRPLQFSNDSGCDKKSVEHGEHKVKVKRVNLLKQLNQAV